ncbi:unnamed protein product, partial [Medioppia subpectinata]
LNILRKFSDLCPQPVVTEEDNKSKIRLLAVFGDNGEEVIAITADDRVYGFGTNRFGRLGLGVNGLIARPQLNATLTGKKITKICYGLGHCIGLTRSGQCYGWGHNSCGQLGIGSVADTPTPQPIKTFSLSLQLKPVVGISCGDNHSLVLTKDHLIYGFGANDRRQCGQTEGEMICTPTKVTINAKFLTIYCGRNHSAALTTTGSVYLWGSNDCQQLGPEAVSVAGQTYCCPQPLKGPNNRIYRQLFCGPDHTVVRTPADTIYCYGLNIWTYNQKSDHLFNAIKLIRESIQSMNIRTESDEEIYFSDPDDEEGVRLRTNTGTVDKKATTCCDPIVDCFQKHLLKAFNNRLDSDLRFKVENQFIYCHKTVLKIRNKEFWEICEQNMFTEREIEMNAYSYDTIKAFLMFLYGLRPEVNDQNCRQLLGLAEEYGEKRLKDICCNLV